MAGLPPGWARARGLPPRCEPDDVALARLATLDVEDLRRPDRRDGRRRPAGSRSPGGRRREWWDG